MVYYILFATKLCIVVLWECFGCSIVQMFFFFGCTILTMIYHINYYSMDWCHFGALGASVGLLLLWTRKVIEKFDGVVGNYSVYVSLDVWMINTSRCFKCPWTQFWAWQICGFGGVLEEILIWFHLRSGFDFFNDLFHGVFVH